MKAAIVHYWLLNMRGGERVLEALCRMLPSADIFTLFYDPERVSPFLRSRRVHASFLNPLRRMHRSLLPAMPYALESFDLRGYDLVISSESGPAKGVIVPSQARHICYCHTPMRYLWDLYPDYLHEWSSPLMRLPLAFFSNRLRLWDFASAARVDEFIANSRNVQKRIWRTYRREAEVVYPPVPVHTFRHQPASDYFLIVSELVAYKRIDVAVRVFSRSGAKLRIVGTGPEYRNLRSMAGPTVQFCGRLNENDLRNALSHCRAILLPGEEDFGIVPVEALASGKPVIALGRGGVLESVPPSCGIFYNNPVDDELRSALQRFETAEPHFQPEVLQKAAAFFSEENFCTAMRPLLERCGERERKHL